MAKWIEVTDISDESKVWIDIDDCAYIEASSSEELGDRTMLGSLGGERPISVRESLQQIMHLSNSARRSRPPFQ